MKIKLEVREKIGKLMKSKETTKPFSINLSLRLKKIFGCLRNNSDESRDLLVYENALYRLKHFTDISYYLNILNNLPIVSMMLFNNPHVFTSTFLRKPEAYKECSLTTHQEKLNELNSFLVGNNFNPRLSKYLSNDVIDLIGEKSVQQKSS